MKKTVVRVISEAVVKINIGNDEYQYIYCDGLAVEEMKKHQDKKPNKVLQIAKKSCKEWCKNGGEWIKNKDK